MQGVQMTFFWVVPFILPKFFLHHLSQFLLFQFTKIASSCKLLEIHKNYEISEEDLAWHLVEMDRDCIRHVPTLMWLVSSVK